ncbi:hypothetical protein KOR42_14420 [Thalassoglobus neptunius]|uniref:Uncharacterized protein n=1 Tax=Thalassoglobus neptunius TaxID=1938619 RepID=A0A5C5X884_9PLAN|nr:hypothetical protein [Thalassoglobus neptunius]TWT58072.1 hypothetical protein KOR42_14420 [Thalassoglobus neptunius]
MNLDEYRQAWKEDEAQMNITFDSDLLSKEVLRSHQSFQSMIYWRDFREVGVSLVMIPLWLLLGSMMSLPWTWYLTIPALIWIAAFIFVDRSRHPQRPSHPGEPLLFYAKESLEQTEHQIWLLRNIFWWYLLPFCISIMAFFVNVAWNSSDGLLGFSLLSGIGAIFLYVIYSAVYRLNQTAVTEQLEPRRDDLQRLIDSLERETDDENAGDIMELVAAISESESGCGACSGWLNWAENWNRLVPSWQTATAIILPTLAGALCGWYSGTQLQIPEMGPTLFQVIVGAVIPFEIVFFSICWSSSKKQKKIQVARDEEAASKPEDRIKTTSSDNGIRLPKAPALVILVLVIFLGVMAFVAIGAFFLHMKEDLNAHNAQVIKRSFHCTNRV